MDLKALQAELNRILLLEKSQVALYTALAAKAPDEELLHGLQRLSQIENDHVQTIEQKLQHLFPTPEDPVHALKNTLADGSLRVFASTVGAAKELTGLIPLMKAAAAGEERAMAHYRQAIARLKDLELRDMFWEHLIDEELHFLWLQKKTGRLN